jgi:hypothetical protein
MDVMSANRANTRENPEPGWWIAYQAIKVRLRFGLALGCLALIAWSWPWLTALSERVASRFHQHARSETVSANSEYFCPMDPGVVSVWPAICPICNMDLIVRKKGEATILPSGVLARMQITPYRLALAGVRTVSIEKRTTANETGESILVVPVTSIVHRASETLVYVETMPGMIDAVRVTLGARVDDCYEVTSSDIQAGQRVVAMGTLLVDAESRLNPNLTTQYFGASDKVLANAEPPKANRPKPLAGETKLDAADQAIVDEQEVCPVTKEPLDSMGGPVMVTIGERRIAICCEGCRKPLERESQKFIQWLDDIRLNGPSPK